MQASPDKFTRNKKMLGGDWKAGIACALPWYKAVVKTSAYQTNVKIQVKLEELKKKKEITWALFVAQELLKLQANLQPTGKTIENGNAINPDSDPDHLDEEGGTGLYRATMAA